MSLLFNELSVEDQFASADVFLAALVTVMRMRECARRYGRPIRVAASLGRRPASLGMQFRQIVREARDVNLRRSVLSWLEKDGPFLEEGPLSSPNDAVLLNGHSVVGSTLAEAACLSSLGEHVTLAGFSPSSFDVNPLVMDLDDGTNTSGTIRVSIDNFWGVQALDAFLRVLDPPLRSWADFELRARRDFPEMMFADGCTRRDHPFNPGVADRIWKLLEMLSQMRAAILPDGTYGAAWNRQWTEWFRGGELFSDSSASEKIEFDAELTFPHPGRQGESIKCTWHGKINSPKLRVHFSFPITRAEPIYVVYIGPKLTKR